MLSTPYRIQFIFETFYLLFKFFHIEVCLCLYFKLYSIRENRGFVCETRTDPIFVFIQIKLQKPIKLINTPYSLFPFNPPKFPFSLYLLLLSVNALLNFLQFPVSPTVPPSHIHILQVHFQLVYVRLYQFRGSKSRNRSFLKLEVYLLFGGYWCFGWDFELGEIVNVKVVD
jgi:hypothetical protein